MIDEIRMFILMLSSLYCFNHLARFFINLFSTEPKEVKLGVVEKVLLYLSSAYILTTIILAIS